MDLPSSSETRLRWEAASESWRYDEETRSENEPSSFCAADMRTSMAVRATCDAPYEGCRASPSSDGITGFRRAGDTPRHPELRLTQPCSIDIGPGTLNPAPTRRGNRSS